jgi:hypothetical protein
MCVCVCVCTRLTYDIIVFIVLNRSMIGKIKSKVPLYHYRDHSCQIKRHSLDSFEIVEVTNLDDSDPIDSGSLIGLILQSFVLSMNNL